MADGQWFSCSFCNFNTQDLTSLLQHNCAVCQIATSQGSSQVNYAQAGFPGGFESLEEENSLEASSESEHKLDRFGDAEVKLLMSCYSEHKHLIGGKKTKKEIFNMIADSFNKQSKFSVTGEQCNRKWSKLVQKAKEVTDHNNKSGNDPKTWKFMEEMSSILGKDGTVTPKYTIESSTNKHQASKGDSSSLDETASSINSDVDSDDSSLASFKPQGKQKRTRKRPKSRSSASEMLDFLKCYTEKKDKIEEEKLNILKEMKEDKNAFFEKFFEMMAKK